MSNKSSEGVFLGQALTNTRLNSTVEVLGDATYTIRLRFVPASKGRYASETGAGESSDLKGALLHFELAGGEGKTFSTRLGKLKEHEHYYASDGQQIEVSAHCASLSAIKGSDTVKIYFARDALACHRTYPIFTVSAMTSDQTATIFERPGKHAHSSALTLDHTDDDAMQWYSGDISGDTWKACSPGFTAADAKSLLTKAGIDDPVIVGALGAIYGADSPVLAGNQFRIRLDVPLPEMTPGELCLVWNSEPGSNPASNISDFSAWADIAQRVHPHTYTAAIAACVACRVKEVLFTSSWRPMIGSAGHRQGTCLDLGYVIDESGKRHGFRWLTLSDDEEKAFKKMEQAKKKVASLESQRKGKGLEIKAAEKEVNRLDKAIGDLKKDKGYAKLQKNADEASKALTALKTLPTPATPDGLKACQLALAKLETAAKQAAGKLSDATLKLDGLQGELKTASETLDQRKKELQAIDADLEKAREDVEEQEREWQEVVAANQPEFIGTFRQSLLDHPLVSQVIDPWVIDFDARDKQAGPANRRLDATEKAHKNHLHLTCIDPELARFR